MYVLAFDRDWTVDVNAHPNREAVPLEWVGYWAHKTDHEVWAIGNQDLVDEAAIPGTVESIRRRDGDISALGERDESGYYEWWPDREHRLQILADLFPDAEGYIVVDDLDLSHVDGWDHYHAWDFVDAVRDDTIDLDIPQEPAQTSATAPDSRGAVKDILQRSSLFKLVHHHDGDERTHLVRNIKPKRPSQIPPSASLFETVDGNQRFTVRPPDLIELQPIADENTAEPSQQLDLRPLVERVETTPEQISTETAVEAIQNAARADRGQQRYLGLQIAGNLLSEDPDILEAIADPTFELLQNTQYVIGIKVLAEMISIAETDPETMVAYIPDLTAIAANESPVRPHATECLMEIAESKPGAVIDAVPALATTAKETEGEPRSYAIYTLATIASEYPEQVFPTVDTLIDALSDENETIQTNALTALGRISASYPDAAEPVAEDLSYLLNADAERVRNNAVGLLGDIAQEHPEVVIDHAAAIAERLDDSNTQARINASIALLEAGEADPEMVREQHQQLEAALSDTSPEVRANSCTLIGNTNAPVSLDKLRTLRDEDPDETVREQAAWALEACDTSE